MTAHLFTTKASQLPRTVAPQLGFPGTRCQITLVMNMEIPYHRLPTTPQPECARLDLMGPQTPECAIRTLTLEEGPRPPASANGVAVGIRLVEGMVAAALTGVRTALTLAVLHLVAVVLWVQCAGAEDPGRPQQQAAPATVRIPGLLKTNMGIAGPHLANSHPGRWGWLRRRVQGQPVKLLKWYRSHGMRLRSGTKCLNPVRCMPFPLITNRSLLARPASIADQRKTTGMVISSVPD